MAAGSSISWTLVFTALCRFDRRTPLGCILFRLGLLPASSAGDTFCLARRHGNTGSVIAGVLAGIWYCKRHQIDWLALADIVCPAILIGQAIGRMANLLNGDAFGTPTGGNFGLLYPEGTLLLKPMAPFLYGQPRFGKASWISLSSRSCFYSALLITLKGRPCVCM